jgi:Domain of unknown function (DUF4424)
MGSVAFARPLTWWRKLSVVSAVLALGGLTLVFASPAPARASEPMAAGGLQMALQPGLNIETTEIVIGPGSVKHTYAVKNVGSAAKTALVAFTLPEIDRFLLGDDGGFSVLRDPVNIVSATTTAAGTPVVLRAQQRAFALGIDVTSAVTQAKLSLLPLDPALEAQIAALPPDQTQEFVERGILQIEDGRPRPGWILQATAYWRQSFPPGKTTVIEHTYVPFAGTQPVSEPAIARAVDRACLPAIAAGALRRRTAEANPPQMTTVIVLHTIVPGQEPATRIRVRLEAPEGGTVATCLEPLIRLDARTVEWTPPPRFIDQDMAVMFVK